MLIYYKDKLIFLIIHPFCRILIFFNPKKSLNCHHSAYKKPYTQYVRSGITIEFISCSFCPVLAQSAFLHTLTTSCLSSSASVNPFSPSSSSLDLFCSFSVTGLNDGSSCPRGKLNNLSANSYNERSVSIILGKILRRNPLQLMKYRGAGKMPLFYTLQEQIMLSS